MVYVSCSYTEADEQLGFLFKGCCPFTKQENMD